MSKDDVVSIAEEIQVFINFNCSMKTIKTNNDTPSPKKTKGSKIMSYICNLYGQLANISIEDFFILKDHFERHMHLDTFEYSDNKILVMDGGFNRRRKISWLEKFVYNHIAECIPERQFGKLYYKEGRFFSCIFFGHKQFEIVEYDEPEHPAWWHGGTTDYINSLKERILDLLRKGVVVP